MVEPSITVPPAAPPIVMSPPAVTRVPLPAMESVPAPLSPTSSSPLTSHWPPVLREAETIAPIATEPMVASPFVVRSPPLVTLSVPVPPAPIVVSPVVTLVPAPLIVSEPLAPRAPPSSIASDFRTDPNCTRAEPEPALPISKSPVMETVASLRVSLPDEPLFSPSVSAPATDSAPPIIVSVPLPASPSVASPPTETWDPAPLTFNLPLLPASSPSVRSLAISRSPPEETETVALVLALPTVVAVFANCKGFNRRLPSRESVEIRALGERQLAAKPQRSSIRLYYDVSAGCGRSAGDCRRSAAHGKSVGKIAARCRGADQGHGASRE